MGELRDVRVELISLVNQGANGEPIQIYKSADATVAGEPEDTATMGEATAQEPETTEDVAKAEETVTDQAPSIEEAVAKESKNFLAKMFRPLLEGLGLIETQVEKAADINNDIDYASFTSMLNNPEYRFQEAIDMLRWSILEIFWDQKITNGRERILQNIDDFRSYIEKILSEDVVIQKQYFEKGAENVKRKDVQAMLSEALSPVTKSLEDLSAKLETLEKTAQTAEPENKEPEAEVQKSAAPSEIEVLKSVVAEALTPIVKSLEDVSERITIMENMRGLAKSAADVSTKKVEKEDDPWPEINFPI